MIFFQIVFPLFLNSLFGKWFVRCLELFQIDSGLFDFVSSGLGCPRCFELFPIILVLLLLVGCLYLFQIVYFGCFVSFCCRYIFQPLNSVVLRCVRWLVDALCVLTFWVVFGSVRVICVSF